MTNKETATLLETAALTFGVCQKTKPQKAKHAKSLLADPSVTGKFLVATLEGHEKLKDTAMICIGEAGDAWQQTPAKLLAKYTVTGIDDQGWLICEPKPDVDVNYCQITDRDNFFIIGQWGQEREVGGEMKPVQYGEQGDYVLQNQKDTTDFWIVKKSLFESTYNPK
jgi:hypothetical protein